ncbi:YopX family protein [Enterococcus entomosocium]|jgi:uncharacterized phage protein (TIGR01671 family)|uniref:YopX family protein n=1 Tax=Enterococcus TaxID=1350 RepID=UPI003BEC1EAB
MVPKFRGKRKDNGEWVVGVPIPNSFCNVVHMIPIILTDKVAYPPERLHEYLIEIVPETLGQSTGLKDKNDVEIFEGDVLLHTSSSVNYSDTYWHSYVQAYRIDNGAFRIKGKHIYDTDLMSARRRIEVVGNIYQHQKLLEKEYFSTSDGVVVQANEN